MSHNQLLTERMIRLSDGATFGKDELELKIEHQCHYVEYALVSTGKENIKIAIILPNTHQLEHPDYRKTIEEGCLCPKNLTELSHCLSSCIKTVNNNIQNKNDAVKIAAIIDQQMISKNEDGSINENKILEDCRTFLKEALKDKSAKHEHIYIMRF